MMGFLPFERALLDKALEKHVLRSDTRSGMRSRPSTSASAAQNAGSDTARRSSFTGVMPQGRHLANLDASLEPEAEMKINSSLRRVSIILAEAPLEESRSRGASKQKENSSLEEAQAAAKKAGIKVQNKVYSLDVDKVVNGTMDVQVEDHTVRCRISQCLDFDEGGRVRSWLAPYCEWDRSEVVGIGRRPSQRVLLPQMLNSPNSPPRSRSRSRSPEGLPDLVAGSTFFGSELEEDIATKWSFVRHLPEQQRRPKEKHRKKKTVTSTTAKDVEPLIQVFFCDAAAAVRAISLVLKEGLPGDKFAGEKLSETFTAIIDQQRPDSRPTTTNQQDAATRAPQHLRRLSKGNIQQPHQDDGRRESMNKIASKLAEQLSQRRASKDKARRESFEQGARRDSRPDSPSSPRRPSMSESRRNSVRRRNSRGSISLSRRMSGMSTEGRRRRFSTGDEDIEPDMMKLEALLQYLPDITLKRWSGLLRADPEGGTPALLAKLASTLKQKPEWFYASTPAESLVMMVELVEPQPPESPAADGGPGYLPMASLNWFGSISICYRLPSALKALSEHWQCELSLQRLMTVASAVEKAESLRLCGGFAITMDVCNHLPDKLVKPMRGHEAVTVDWLTRLIEAKEEDTLLEAGDIVRLIAHRAAQEQFLTSKEDGDLFGEEERDQPVFNDEVWGKFFWQHAEVFPLKDNYPALAFVAAAKAVLPENARSYFEVSYGGAVGQIVLELLLQRQVALAGEKSETTEEKNLAQSVEELCSELLWRLFGWDSPQGRRLIRRLSRLFFRLTATSNEELSKPSYLRLCADAGWTAPIKHKKKLQTGENPFVSYFTQAIGTNSGADLIDFLYLLELITHEVIRPKHGLNGTFAALEITVTDLANAVNHRESHHQRHGKAAHAPKTTTPSHP